MTKEKFTSSISAFTGLENIKIGQVFKVHNDDTTLLLMRLNPEEYLLSSDIDDEQIECLSNTKEAFCFCNLLTGELDGFYLGKNMTVNVILSNGIITVYDSCDFIPFNAM